MHNLSTPTSWVLATLGAIGFLLASTTSAQALDFRADFRASTYAATAGDTFSDLLAQHQSETIIQSNVVDGLEDISTDVYAAGVNEDYSLLLQATVEIGTAGRYEFQVGTDWGLGGATALIDNNTGSILSERVVLGNTWWNLDWDHGDVFTTAFDFEEGDSFTLMWVGFEDCCGGSSTIRFSVDGSDFAPLTTDNAAPYTVVPSPSAAMLLGLGLMGLAARTRAE